MLFFAQVMQQKTADLNRQVSLASFLSDLILRFIMRLFFLIQKKVPYLPSQKELGRSFFQGARWAFKKPGRDQCREHRFCREAPLGSDHQTKGDGSCGMVAACWAWKSRIC